MNNKAIIQFGFRWCYPPWPPASEDNILLDLQNSSYPTQPHSTIANNNNNNNNNDNDNDNNNDNNNNNNSGNDNDNNNGNANANDNDNENDKLESCDTIVKEWEGIWKN